MSALPYRSGVGIMLANPQGLVFVGQRLDSSRDAWQMPQGGVDPGEEPEAAALRELEEETGISPAHVTIISRCRRPYDYDLPPDLIPTIWNGRFRGQRQHWYLLGFDGDESAIDIATEQPEFSAWRWVGAEDLPQLIVPFKRRLYTALVEEFGPQIAALRR